MNRTLQIPMQSTTAPLSQPAAQADSRGSQPFVLTVFAVGMIGLGILALVCGDFALVWQPVAPWVPGRTALAYSSGGLMLFCGVGLLLRATRAWSVRILFPYLITWALLKVPALVVAPQMEAVWLGFGEVAVLLAGGWVLFARMSDLRSLSWATGYGGARIARLLFGVWLVPIGLSHFFYVKQTVELIPVWLPFKAGWAYLTGAGHVAAGMAVLLSIVPRAAARAEAAMISIFALVVWAPRIAAAPGTRLPWTAFLITWAIAAAAWVVAADMTPRKNSEG